MPEPKTLHDERILRTKEEIANSPKQQAKKGDLVCYQPSAKAGVGHIYTLALVEGEDEGFVTSVRHWDSSVKKIAENVKRFLVKRDRLLPGKTPRGVLLELGNVHETVYEFRELLRPFVKVKKKEEDNAEEHS